MLPSSERRVVQSLGDDARVLDVGGWASPLARADAVIDLMPYETRGLYGAARTTERFNADTWVVRDICASEPWPFRDHEFDFVVCSHTLEDLRDPIHVCQEMQRVARAGYIEVPSRLEEQTYGVEGPWVGRSHHRWLIDIGDRSISFVCKPHMLHREGAHFPAGFDGLLDPEEAIQMLWWEDGFDCGEHIFYEIEEHDSFIESFVARNLEQRPLPKPDRGLIGRTLSRRRRRAGS